MDPINYIRDVQSPFQAALAGYQGGAAIRNDQLQQQQQALQIQQAQAQQQALQALMANPNPTPQDYANATLAVPGMREQFKQAAELRGAAQAQGDLAHVSQVYAALSQNQPSAAIQLMNDRAAALRNAGREDDAKHLDVMAGIAEQSPQMARTMAGLYLSSVPGGDKVISGAATLGAEARAEQKQPAEVRSANAKAATEEAAAAVAPVVQQAGASKAVSEAGAAAVTAKYAEQGAILDLQKKGWDINALKADIDYKRESNRIATMNAVTAREGNGLKRQELQLQIEKARTDLDDKIRTRAAEAESSAATIDNFLNTIERIKSTAVGKDGKPTSILRAAAGPVDSRLPTMQSDVADLEALVETLGSQAFLSQIPQMKGTGSLSEREGDKLQSALTNLSLRQSPEQLVANINEAYRLINKSRQTLAKRTGVPLQPIDTPAAKPRAASSDFVGGTGTTKGGATVSGW